MSTNRDLEMRNIAARLVEERKRLGHTQASAQVFAGCGRQAWIDKESGRSELKALELARLDRYGYDVYFILTGAYAGGPLSPSESLLIEAFRGMRQSEQSMLLGSALGWAHPTRILPWLAGGTDQQFAVKAALEDVEQEAEKSSGGTVVNVKGDVGAVVRGDASFGDIQVGGKKGR